MPIVPNAIERFFLLRRNRGPGFFLDLLGAGALEASACAERLGVFEALAKGPMRAADLAEAIDADARGAEALLTFLEAAGYVRERGGRYENSPMTATWLVRSSPGHLADGLPFWSSYGFAFWRAHLDEAVRHGRPSTSIYEWFGTREGAWRVFQEYVRALARFSIPEIVRRLPIPPAARRLLDLGGGHGLFSVELCRRHAGLTSVVFDLPEALRAAEDTIAGAGLGDRVTVQAGDFWHDDLGDGYDAVLLFNVLHGHGGEENGRLLRRAADALRPGGMVVILDQLAGPVPGRAVRAIHRFFGLTYLVTLGGRIHAYEDMTAWLTDAGFVGVRRVGLRSAPGTSLVLAMRAA